MSRFKANICWLLGAIMLASCSSTGAPAEYAAPGANKGEISFINSCIRDRVDCRWLRWTQVDAFTYRVVDTYAFQGNLPLAELTERKRCDGLKEAGVRSWGPGTDATTYEFKHRRDGQCGLHVPARPAPSALAQKFGQSRPRYHFLRRYGTFSTRSVDSRINVSYQFASATRTRAMFQSAPGMILYGESTPINGSGVQPSVRDSHGYVFDFNLKANEVTPTIGMSAYPSWKEYGKHYMQVWQSKVSTPVAAAAKPDVNAALAEALKEFAGLGLRYKITQENQGTYPQLDASEVMHSKVGDCKDLAVVMASILARHGLAAEPVTTHLSSGAARYPTLMRIPQLSWPDHVFLYVPKAGIYIDPTLDDGKFSVGELYPVYRQPGVNLATGKFVFIGQAP